MDMEFMKLRDQMKPLVSQENPPIYDLFAMWVKPRRGNIRCYPTNSLLFNACVSGGYWICLYEQLDIPIPSTRFYVFLMALEIYPHKLFQILTP
jgi:hypothetical protein